MPININNLLRFGRHLHLDSQIYVEGDGGRGVQTVVKLLANAEITTLKSSPTVLVAAQANKLIFPISGFLASNITTPYEQDGGITDGLISVQIGPDEAAFEWFGTTDNQIYSASSGTFLSTLSPTPNLVNPSLLYVGTALKIASWAIDDPHDGDGVILVSVSYRIVDVSAVF